MDFGIAAVPAVTVLSWLVGEVIKLCGVKTDLVPALCSLAGALLGVAAMYLLPDFPARDVISALAIGAVSGLAATGANEVKNRIGK